MPGQCLLQEVDQRRVNPTSGVEECSEVCWKYPSIIFQYTWACLPLVFQISKPWIFFWRRFQIYLELITRLFVPIHQLLFWTTWSWRLIFLPPDSPAVATPLLASLVRKIVLSDRVITENSVNIMPLLLGTHSTHPSADWNIRFHFCSWSDEVFHFFVLLIRIIMYCKHYFTVCTAGSQQLKYPEPRYE